MNQVLLEEPTADTAAALLERYESDVADAVEAVGADRAATVAGEEAATVASRGDAGDLDLRDVAALLSLRDDASDAETILTEIRDTLLLEMSSAMLDVDRLAADLGDIDPREVQGKIEGRHPMTLAEYARLRHAIATAN